MCRQSAIITVIGSLMAAMLIGTANGQCVDNPAFAPTCMALFYNTATNTSNTTACTNPVFASLVPNCPFSCNLCNQLGYGCNNTLPQATCAALAASCNNTAFTTFMLDYCPQTCALCPIIGGGTCSDVVANCSALAFLCNNPQTFSTLTQECPFTCGRCPTGASTASTTTTTTAALVSCTGLVDSSQCSTWIANQFCTSTFYSAATKLANCPNGCGLCSSG